MQRLKSGEAVAGDETEARLAGVLEGRDERQRRTRDASDYGIKVEGVDDVVVRLAKCCRPVPGDEIVGYVSLGRGITIHREDCRNVEALRKSPERFCRLLGRRQRDFLPGRAAGRRLGSDPAARTFRGPSPRPGSTSSRPTARPSTPMVRNRFVVESTRSSSSSA